MIFAPGIRTNVTPNSNHVNMDFELSDDAVQTPPPTSRCDLVLGTVSGTVLLNGAKAPDGTVVSVETGPNAPVLTQTVGIKDGRYEATSVGTRCNGDLNFLVSTVSTLGETVITKPDQPTTTNDINIRR